MIRWALTGGIASGKSTVAKMFVAQGVPVIDADRIYHGLIAPLPGSVAPSPLASQVAQAFDGVLMTDGSIDRPKLGRIVFASAAQRARLEAITHPAVHAQVERLFAELESRGHTHALYDVPLLFERALQQAYARTVVVWVPQALQLARLMARDGIDADAAMLRLQSQWPLDSKRDRADHVIDNSGDVAQTQKHVAALVAAMGLPTD